MVCGRAGLDDETVQLLQKFANVVYISCNPNTLVANLKEVWSRRLFVSKLPLINILTRLSIGIATPTYVADCSILDAPVCN